MKTEIVQTLTATFEGHAQQTEGGIDNFLNVVSKAKTACEVSGHAIADHFADVGKMVDLGSDKKAMKKPDALDS